MEKELLQRIVVDPEVMVGKPVIRGTRIPVELIVRLLGQGMSQEEILNEYPSLQPDDLRAALRDRQGHKGVLLLRLRDERTEIKIDVIRRVLDAWADRLPLNFTVATESRIRIRKT